MCSTPTVSVIVPLHNKIDFIAETVKSVQEQILENWELLVVDDSSSDGSREVVETFTDSRIRIYNSVRHGPSAARNAGICVAQGDWILFLDADDLLESFHLSELLRTASQHPNASAVVSLWYAFDSASGRRRELGRTPVWGRDHSLVLDYAIVWPPWVSHAALIRRQQLHGDLLWPEQCDALRSEDVAFWYGVLLENKIAWCGKPGALYRINVGASRSSQVGADLWFRSTLATIEENLRKMKTRGRAITPKQCFNILGCLEGYYRLALRDQDTHVASEALKHAEIWLAQCQASPGVFLRKWLGISHYSYFAELKQKLVRFSKMLR